jgi:hypothetical protein
MNRWVEIWLLYGATCSAGGWILSWLHALNPAGYVLLHGGFLALVLWLYRCPQPWSGWEVRRLRSRFFPKRKSGERFFSFRRMLPLSFLLLASLSLLAGFLYAPNNYDALTYRIPRVMHWLQNDGWLWIHTDNARMNTRATGFEWLMAPQLSILKTDRFIFVVNWLSYLLLPGLLFSFLRALGRTSRAAWIWMWVFPLGLGYVLQAAGIANDAFATPYGLTALVCGMNFFRCGSARDFWFALLAAALLSGTKASNLPWLLPIGAVLIWGMIQWRKGIPAYIPWSPLLLIFAGLASFLPTAWMNYRHCGDWTGTSLEDARFVKSPWVGLAGNGLQVMAQNFSPPVFPGAGAWDQSLVEHLPKALLIPLRQNFESSFRLGLAELPTEGSGLGLGLCLCLLFAALAGRSRGRLRPHPLPKPSQLILWLGPLALLWFLSKSALAGVSRVILPYFPLAMAPIMAREGTSLLLKNRFFRGLVIFTFLSALGAVILDPSKPLWPATQSLATPSAHPSLERIRQRAYTVYRNYGQRAEVYQPARALLPPGTTRLGFLNGTDDPVASLWKPYGTLRVEEVTSSEGLADLQRRGLSLILAGEKGILERRGQTLNQWQSSLRATPIGKVTLQPAVQRENEIWVLLAIPSSPADVVPQ